MLRLCSLIAAAAALQLPGRRPQVSAPPGFTAPEPRPLAVTDNAQIPGLLRGSAALAVRLATGVFVLGWRPSYVAAFGATLLGEAPRDGEYVLELGPFKFRDDSSVLPEARPAKPIVIYEYESSPFCRKVREACCLFDLEVEYRPVPGARGGAFARELLETSGRMTVPYMVDPNAGDRGMLESDDIIEYLREAYGPPKDSYDALALWPLRGAFAATTATFAAIARGLPCGVRRDDARDDNEQMLPLELWGYEASPFVKPVRESLCELTLPHVVVPCSRGSPNRDRMVKETGRFQVPYLKDPNTGVALFESAEIVKYLDEVYTK